MNKERFNEVNAPKIGDKLLITCYNCGHVWLAKYKPGKKIYQCSVCKKWSRVKVIENGHDGKDSRT